MWYTHSFLIQIAMILRKVFLAKYFLQYFQYWSDMPFFDSVRICMAKVLVYIDLYFYCSQNITDYLTFLFQGTKYLLLTWSSFVWCHVIYSGFWPIPDAYDKNTVTPFRCFLSEWIQRFSKMLWICEDGLCRHWYVLGLIATHMV